MVEATTDAPTSATSKSNPPISNGNMYSLINAIPMVLILLKFVACGCTGDSIKDSFESTYIRKENVMNAVSAPGKV